MFKYFLGRDPLRIKLDISLSLDSLVRKQVKTRARSNSTFQDYIYNFALFFRSYRPLCILLPPAERDLIYNVDMERRGLSTWWKWIFYWLAAATLSRMTLAHFFQFKFSYTFTKAYEDNIFICRLGLEMHFNFKNVAKKTVIIFASYQFPKSNIYPRGKKS